MMVLTWRDITWEEFARDSGCTVFKGDLTRARPQRCGDRFRVLLPENKVFHVERSDICNRCNRKLSGPWSRHCSKEDDLCWACVMELTT